MTVPMHLVQQAFDAAGEKRFALARAFYPLVYGAHWREAILGFAYMKCVDDLVDEDRDAARALRTLATQERFIADVYARRNGPDREPAPQRFGYPFFCFDRDHGQRLRPLFEAVLRTMEIDTRRRGALVSAAELDALTLEVGGNVIRFLLGFALPEAPLPAEFIQPAARAYLYADSLIDLEHDLDFGLINIPAEDFQRGAMHLSAADPAVRAWTAARSHEVLAEFRTALANRVRLRHRSQRLLVTLYLVTKRRSLLRFLARQRLTPATAESLRACAAE